MFIKLRVIDAEIYRQVIERYRYQRVRRFTQKDPKEPKWTQKEPKRTQRDPKGTQKDPKGTQMEIEMFPHEH